MKIELVMDDEAVDALAASLAKAMAKAKPATSGKTKTKAVAPAPEAEAAEDVGETVDTGEDTGAETTTTAEEDFGEDTGGEDTAPKREEVLAALKAVSGNAALGQEQAVAILKKHGGCSKLSSLEAPKFAAVIKAANEAVAKAKKK